MEDRRENEHRPIQICFEKRLHQVVNRERVAMYRQKKRMILDLRKDQRDFSQAIGSNNSFMASIAFVFKNSEKVSGRLCILCLAPNFDTSIPFP